MLGMNRTLGFVCVFPRAASLLPSKLHSQVPYFISKPISLLVPNSLDTEPEPHLWGLLYPLPELGRKRLLKSGLSQRCSLLERSVPAVQQQAPAISIPLKMGGWETEPALRPASFSSWLSLSASPPVLLPEPEAESRSLTSDFLEYRFLICNSNVAGLALTLT